jgi:hypothetical protein
VRLTNEESLISRAFFFSSVIGLEEGGALDDTNGPEDKMVPAP